MWSRLLYFYCMGLHSSFSEVNWLFFFFCSSLVVDCRFLYSCGGEGRGYLFFGCVMRLPFLSFWRVPLKLCLGWLLLGIFWSCIRGIGAHLELLSHALAHTCTLSHLIFPLHALTYPQMALYALACPLLTCQALACPCTLSYIIAHPPMAWHFFSWTCTSLHVLAQLWTPLHILTRTHTLLHNITGSNKSSHTLTASHALKCHCILSHILTRTHMSLHTLTGFWHFQKNVELHASTGIHSNQDALI